MDKTTQVLSPDEWVDRYADQLYRFAFARTSHEEVARELIQETFLSGLKSAPGFKGEISEKNWLFTILKNKIIDYYRKKAPVYLEDINQHTNEEDAYFNDNGHWNETNGGKEWPVTEQTVLENQEFMRILQTCKGKLNNMQQAVFSMKYLDEEDAENICKELGISSSNYWVLLHRAKLNLRSCLEKNWLNR